MNTIKSWIGMDSKTLPSFCLSLLIISSILCSQSRGDGSASVYFLDRSPNYYIQSPSSQSKSMSLPEVGAAISVLLGYAPPSTLSSASSGKLNEVLTANPFNRPRAVFLLEISGFGDKQTKLGSDSNVFSRALKSEVTIEDAEIQVFGKGETIQIDRPLHNTELTDEAVTDFASWMDGSYVSSSSEPLTGELTIFLSNDEQLKLHMSKKADREFTRSLVSLIDLVQTAVQLHEDFEGSKRSPAELIKGRFDGFKAFQEYYGTNDTVQKGAELLVATVSKIYDTFQTSHKGQIVGVVVLNDSPTKESNTLFNVKFTTRPSPRWLEEKEGSADAEAAAAAASKIAEVFLVRRVLAWITGIILIISTLMGIWFLMYMPITRDTLLYSNVKLD